MEEIDYSTALTELSYLMVTNHLTFTTLSAKCTLGHGFFNSRVCERSLGCYVVMGLSTAVTLGSRNRSVDPLAVDEDMKIPYLIDLSTCMQ